MGDREYDRSVKMQRAPAVDLHTEVFLAAEADTFADVPRALDNFSADFFPVFGIEGWIFNRHQENPLHQIAQVEDHE